MTEDEIGKAAAEYFKNLFEGKCPVCKVPIEQEEQVGRSVYAQPCGHRLYQGQVGAFSKKKDKPS